MNCCHFHHHWTSCHQCCCNHWRHWHPAPQPQIYVTTTTTTITTQSPTTNAINKLAGKR
jgi:hypothetical protein